MTMSPFLTEAPVPALSAIVFPQQQPLKKVAATAAVEEEGENKQQWSAKQQQARAEAKVRQDLYNQQRCKLAFKE